MLKLSQSKPQGNSWPSKIMESYSNFFLIFFLEGYLEHFISFIKPNKALYEYV